MRAHPIVRPIVVSGILMSGFSNCPAAVKLLTGDANNQVHNSSATVVDLSSDGDLVLFATSPPVVGTTPGITKGGLYVRKISTNTLTYVDDEAVPGTGDASFSDNGRYITFRDTSGMIYWRDSVADDTRLITPSADGQSKRPVMSADGRYVAYSSVARNIVSNTTKLQPAGHPGVYLYDSMTRTTTVVSLTSSGSALNTGLGGNSSVASAFNEFDLSADGKYIVFSTDATNAHADRTSNYPSGFLCVYRRNLGTGAMVLLNKTKSGSVADGNFSMPRVSANGARVSFMGGFVGTFKGVRLIDSVNNAFGSDMYAKDAGTGELWWVSKTTDKSNPDGVFNLANAISGDGETVCFASSGTKFVTENTDPQAGKTGTFDIFRADLGDSGNVTVTLATKSPNNSGNVDYFAGPLLPGNGDYTAFSTYQVAAMLGTGNTDTMNFQGFGVSGPVIPAKPEISVQQPAGSELTDGGAKKSFGTVIVGKKGTAKTFTIRNAGKATLTNLAVSKTGADKADFIVGKLSASSLAPGATAKFTVTFKPKAKGARKAAIKIASSDADENPFDIKLAGMGKAP